VKKEVGINKKINKKKDMKASGKFVKIYNKGNKQRINKYINK